MMNGFCFDQDSYYGDEHTLLYSIPTLKELPMIQVDHIVRFRQLLNILICKQCSGTATLIPYVQHRDCMVMAITQLVDASSFPKLESNVILQVMKFELASASLNLKYN